MARLLIVTQRLWDSMESLGQNPRNLFDSEWVCDNISLHDIVESQLIADAFPFHMDAALDIRVQDNMLAGMDLEQNESYRLQYVSQLQTSKLKAMQQETGYNMSAYTLKPFDGERWVAVQQRLHSQGRDPKNVLYSSNQEFFDSMIAQVLQVMPFEKLCKTNLFSYYLKSLDALPPVAA